MDMTFDRDLARIEAPAGTPVELAAGAGTSSGINMSPGSDDDGWTVPPPVQLDDGTRIQLYKDGEALRAAYEAIKEAQSHVCLEIYIFHDDDTGRAFADLLCHKSRRGVLVYVIYDSLGSIDSSDQMFRQMHAAGINLQQFHPIQPWECKYSWRPFNRDHRKLLVIDHHIGGLGGLNIGQEYAGSWIGASSKGCTEFWRDNAIGVVGPSASHLMRAFAKSWRYVTHGGRIGRAELLHNIDSGQFGVLASVPTRDSPVAGLLNKLVREARTSIQLTMAYFAPSDELIDELCRAARRGVKVQLMLPGRCDVKLLLVAARSFYEKLLSAGVEVYERQGVILHAKTMLIDGHTTVIGSLNLDYRSIEYNLELSALVRCHELGRHVARLFDNDVHYARRIQLSEWRRRPWLDRVGQWAVSRARYVL